MCLQHSINNLLQSELFSPASLADIARELDLLERAHLDPGTRLRGEEAFASQNVDESGFFSVQGELIPRYLGIKRLIDALGPRNLKKSPRKHSKSSV